MDSPTHLVLVTGGTGYIARWCIAGLLDRGYSVRTTVRRPEAEATVLAGVAEAGVDVSRLSFAHADLLADDGWDAAVAGCRYVIHPASPLGARDESVLIATARDGATRVLRAALDGGVERVVMTSAANASSHTSYRTAGVTDETLWTDPDAPGIDAYRRSKTLAERAAWDLAERSGHREILTTILPGAVVGPILGADHLGTVQVVGRLLRGEMARVPRIGLEVVDVRDVADAHILAMTAPDAAGERFLATGELMWMTDMAALLRDELGVGARRVPTRTSPDFVIRLMAHRKPELKGVVIGLGRRNVHTVAKAERVLGWTRRPAATAVVDCARSLIAHGVA